MFIVHGADSKKAIKGKNVVPGRPEEQCAYRAEHGVVAGILTLAEIICSKFVITRQLEIGLNGESVIKKLRLPIPSHRTSITTCLWTAEAA